MYHISSNFYDDLIFVIFLKTQIIEYEWILYVYEYEILVFYKKVFITQKMIYAN